MNKILLVDDEIEITEINKRYLEQGGYDIDIANDGKEALEKYKRNKYSLIITDIMMPNMDGYDLISEVQYLDAEQPFLSTSSIKLPHSSHFLPLMLSCLNLSSLSLISAIHDFV